MKTAVCFAGVAIVSGAAIAAAVTFVDSNSATTSSEPTPDIVTKVLANISNDRLRSNHTLLASEVHVAGTPGDWRTIERIEKLFAEAGLVVERQEITPLLSHPVEASLTIVSPDLQQLNIKESAFKQDPAAAENQSFGWNAYSASGDITAPVVYVNYGTPEDFEYLRSQGVKTQGTIALARYGRNFRGYKAKYAQEAGCSGLVIFTDPGDSGYSVGEVYPNGGYASDCCIQRGSVLVAPYSGDPLSPGVECYVGFPTPPPGFVTPFLPTIPVQPIGYAAAREILSRMQGGDAPKEWQGGFSPAILTYKLTSDNQAAQGLRLRMNVQQERKVIKTANVIATLRGSTFPDEYVIVGAHHDAWNHGAADPLCGTITVIEAARVLGQLAAEGVRPMRTVIFAAWAAEEFGIIGSNEWVERNITSLSRGGVMYINLDMASMGNNLGISASPSLRGIAIAAAAATPQAANHNVSALTGWAAKSSARGDSLRPRMPMPGPLGGGSDHVGFVCFAGVASMAIGGDGSKGTSYHSAFDTLPWYWKVVGSDYESARMVTGVTVAAVMATAYVENPGVAPQEYAYVAADKLRAARDQARKQNICNEDVFAAALAEAGSAALAWVASDQRNITSARAIAVDRVWTDAPPTPGSIMAFHGFPIDSPVLAGKSNNSSESVKDTGDVGDVRNAGDDVWINNGIGGLPERPWFRNHFASPDETSGYAAWILPGVQHALLKNDKKLLNWAVNDVRERLEKLAALAKR